MVQLIRRVSWSIFVLFVVVFTIFLVGPYLSLSPAVSRIPLNPAVSLHFPILVIHAIAGGLALLLGPFQFLSSLRTKYPVIHRISGRIYLIGALLGSVAGLFLAVSSKDGFVGSLGLACLAIVWLYSTCRAYLAIRQGHIQLHRVWVRRNYALTLAAITFRLWFFTGTLLLHFPLQEVYATAAWVSWIFPLLVVEWLFNQRLLEAGIVKRGQRAH